MLMSKILIFISTIFSFASGSHLRRDSHQDLAKRVQGDVGIHKRSFDNARFTFYDVGLGACGKNNVASDFIVALTVTQFGGGYPGPYCFQSITITYGGKTAQATIMDECMGCPYGGLDFSRGLFDYFASEGDGVIYGSWSFNDGSETTTTTTKTTSSSSVWTPTPTSTSVSTSVQPATTSSTTSYSTTSTISESSVFTSSIASTSITASASSVSTTVESEIAVPTSIGVVGADNGNSQNLQVINGALIQLGSMLTAQRGP